MAKYRKKPIIVKASKYKKGMEDGFDCFGYESWNITQCKFDCGNAEDYKKTCIKENRARPYIKTLEGKMYISNGDYIITGVKGEKYPCKPDIFEATYELVE